MEIDSLTRSDRRKPATDSMSNRFMVAILAYV